MKLRSRFAWQFGLAAAAGAIFMLVTATTVSLTSIRNMGADVRTHVDSALFEQTKIGAEALLTSFAAALRDPLYFNEFTKIDKAARAVAAASNIVSVRVYGPKHLTIHDGSGDLTHFGEPAPEALTRNLPHGTLISWIDGDALQFGMSVCAESQCFGLVSVGYNARVLNDAVRALDDKVDAAEHAFVVRVLTLAGVALGVAAILANAFGAIAGRRFSGALEAAIQGIERIARGDTDVEVSRTIDGELDSLALSVEELSRQLTATRTDRDAILTNMIDGLAVTDLNGVIVLANPALAGLVGKSVENLVGRNLRELLSPKPGSLSGARLAQAFGKAESLTLSGGRKLAAMVAASIMELASEHEGRILCVIRDVTERAEREAQLREAKQKAELADRAKAEFLANVSHEIRTPMNGVMAMAELLAKTELDTKQKKFTSVIVRSGRALVAIINDVLDFSKINSGQLEFDPKPFNLTDAVDDVATLLSAKAQDKELELVARFQPDLPEMFVGDVGRIRQIITNLVGNAIKFTESGHVLVDVSSTVTANEAVEESQGRTRTVLLVKVVDSGVGIPADKIDQVFEKFSQIDGSSTRKHEGTGLGLAISRKLVEQMGGKIGVDSQPDQGSTFWFTLPLPVHDVGTPRKSVPADVSSARILVIDDNEVNRSVLLEQLDSWKFDATAAPSGRDGIAVLSHGAQIDRPVDLVILDDQMPGMDGADVAAAIRADAAIKKTPIIMLTSVDDKRSSHLPRDLAIQGQLVKPVRAAVLLDTLIAVLRDAHDATPEEADSIETKDEVVAVPRRGRNRSTHKSANAMARPPSDSEGAIS